MFEERKNLLNNMARSENRPNGKSSYRERSKEADVHIERIRSMLLARETK